MERPGLIVFAATGAGGLRKLPATDSQPSPLRRSRRMKRPIDSHSFWQMAGGSCIFSPDTVLGSLDGGPARQVLTNDFGARYDFWILAVRDRATRCSPARSRPSSSRRWPGANRRRSHGLSGSGGALFDLRERRPGVRDKPPVNVRLTWVDRTGRPIQSWVRFLSGVTRPRAFSDGKRIAMESVPRPRRDAAPWANQEVWIFEQIVDGRPN